MFHCFFRVHKKKRKKNTVCNLVKIWASCVLKIFGQLRNVHRKTRVLESLFNKVTSSTLGDWTHPFSHATEICVIIGLMLQCKTIYQNIYSKRFLVSTEVLLAAKIPSYSGVRIQGERKKYALHFLHSRKSKD